MGLAWKCFGGNFLRKPKIFNSCCAVGNNIIMMLNKEREKVLINISSFLDGLDDFRASLEKKICVMLDKKTGTSCIVLGPAGSGKRSIIRDTFRKYAGVIHFVEHNARFDDLVTGKTLTHQLDELLKEKKHVCYVIYNFERFRRAFGNNILYTLADTIRQNPIILILTGETQNGLSVFEKRIGSRLSAATLRILPRSNTGDLWKAFKNMIEDATSDLPVTMAANFKLPDEAPYNFLTIARRTPVYAHAKLLAKEVVDVMFDSNFQDGVMDCMEKVLNELSGESFDRDIVNGLSERQYGILVCAAIVSVGLSQPIPSRKVFVEYLRFLNVRTVKNVNLQLDSYQFDAEIRVLVHKRLLSAKCQGRRILFLNWIMDPLPLLDAKIMSRKSVEFKLYREERSDLKHL